MELRFCPDCGSPAVDFSQLVGGEANCNGCKWEGKIEDLAVMPIQDEFGLEPDLIQRMVGDLRTMLAKETGVEFLKFFNRWGFVKFDPADVSGTINRREFSRYLAAVGRGIATSLLEERAKIEQDRSRSAVSDN